MREHIYFNQGEPAAAGNGAIASLFHIPAALTPLPFNIQVHFYHENLWTSHLAGMTFSS